MCSTCVVSTKIVVNISYQGACLTALRITGGSPMIRIVHKFSPDKFPMQIGWLSKGLHRTFGENSHQFLIAGEDVLCGKSLTILFTGT